MKKIVNSFIAFLVIGSFVLSVTFAKEENETGLSSMHGVNGEFEVHSVENTEIRPQSQITEPNIPINTFTDHSTEQQVEISPFFSLKIQQRIYNVNESMPHNLMYRFGHFAIYMSQD